MPKPLTINMLAEAMEERLGPVFGSPEYLADPIKLARAEKRLRDAAMGHVQCLLSTIKEAGWKVVPEVPTEEMLDAYWHQTGESKEMRSRTHAYMLRYYPAMLSSSPDIEDTHS